MEQKCGPVVLINKFNVAPEHVEAFLTAWAGTTSIWKQQPGYISTQLHKGVVRIPLKPISHSGFKPITRSCKYRSLRPAQSDQSV
jgi:hypothetical protein